MTSQLPPRAAGATRLVLLRHGEPDDTVRGRCYGRLDPGLSLQGREQMRRTWRLLPHSGPIAAIYVSPSRRAIESVGLRANHRPEVTVDERLREIDFGELEGLTYEEIATRCPETYDAWMTRPTEVSFPGGEGFSGMSARVLEAIDGIRRRHRGETVVTVSHGGVNRVVLAAALDLDPRRIFRLDQAYACVNIVDYLGDEPLVRVINAIAPVPC
jgi:alpha-ribazole phosphatase/probable phosphoglycerate mutase